MYKITKSHGHDRMTTKVTTPNREYVKMVHTRRGAYVEATEGFPEQEIARRISDLIDNKTRPIGEMHAEMIATFEALNAK